jgi:hypothetical protein
MCTHKNIAILQVSIATGHAKNMPANWNSDAHCWCKYKCAIVQCVAKSSGSSGTPTTRKKDSIKSIKYIYARKTEPIDSLVQNNMGTNRYLAFRHGCTVMAHPKLFAVHWTTVGPVQRHKRLHISALDASFHAWRIAMTPAPRDGLQ